jgi:hypothetical protein
MLQSLKNRVLQFAVERAPLRSCPQCTTVFKPFADAPPTSFTDPVRCPKCGHESAFVTKQTDAGSQVIGPVAQPADTRIEMTAPSPEELLFHIPKGRWPRGLIFFAVFWNLISWGAVLAFGSHVVSGEAPKWIWLHLIIFPSVGLGMFYAVIRTRFAEHLIYLGPELIRLQRSLFRKTNHDLATAEVTAVEKVSFYQQNYQPVYGVQISAGKKRIRFGSALSEAEKNWLVWECRRHLAEHGKLPLNESAGQ